MIEPKKQTLEDIFSKSKLKYRIPKYQRSFDWGKSEVLELIDDVNDSVKYNSSLFLGSFIFDTSDNEFIKVVDGQQRMTTISLLFIALREQAKNLNEGVIAEKIQSHLAYSDPIRVSKTNAPVQPLFKASDKIEDLFNHMIDRDWDGNFPDKLNTKGVKRQVSRLKPLYRSIFDQIKHFNTEKLREFITALYDSYVVVLEVDDDQDVYNVFERTNARGLDLNIGDLLKNMIFSQKNNDLNERWDIIVENSTGTLQRMLKYFYISRRGHITSSQLYKNIKNYSHELDNNPRASVEKFVLELEEFSLFYKFTVSLDKDDLSDFFDQLNLVQFNKEYSFEAIIRVFTGFKFFRITQVVPLTFSLFRSISKGFKYDEKKVIKFIETLEKYHFTNNYICGKVANEVEKFYASSAKNLFISDAKKDVIANVYDELRRIRASENEFTPNFIETVNYDNKASIHYVYDKLNNFDKTKKKYFQGAEYYPLFRIDNKYKKYNLNIEHIFSQSDHDKIDGGSLHQIGNLLVMSLHTNSSLQNDTFTKKMKRLKENAETFNNFKYLSEFLSEYKDYNEWGEEQIIDRSKKIASEMYNKVLNY